MLHRPIKFNPRIQDDPQIQALPQPATTTMAPKIKKAYTGKGKERPPAIDKLLLPAIGIGLALLLFQFFKGINSEVSEHTGRL
jgi:ATP:corrinoid adenosyltransferase